MVALALVAGAFMLVLHRKHSLNAMPTPVKRPYPARVAVVTSGPMTVREGYLGRIQPIHAAALASNVAGDLTAVNGYPGDAFRSGQVLIRMDDRALQRKAAAVRADLESAENELQIRQKAFKRVHSLNGTYAVSEEKYDYYKMERDLAKSRRDRIRQELENAAIELAYATVAAPFDGVILRRLHEPGDNIRAGEAVLELEDPGMGYKVVLQVPSKTLAQIGIGTPAYLATGGVETKARISRIFPMISATGTLATIEIDLDEPPPGLRSGESVHVDLVAATPVGFRVPLQALLETDSQYIVYKVGRDDRARPVPVALLGRTELSASVSGALAAGDRVIVADEAALLRMGEDTPIRVVEELK